MNNMFHIPPPTLQVAFSERLIAARSEYMQDALFQTLRTCDVVVLNQESEEFVPPEAAQILLGRGLRVEVLFALPTVLRINPRLLAYYRLLLGYSQKAAYASPQAFLKGYGRVEDGKGWTPEQLETLPELCHALNEQLAWLLTHVVRTSSSHVTATHLDDLTLLTLGPQLRGGRNVVLGIEAVKQVFDVIQEIIGSRAHEITPHQIILEDATHRTIVIRFSADPDIEAVSLNPHTHEETPLLAIEVKGGTDYSNVHNRLGEAEKSHLKAKNERHFTDLWTIINVTNLTSEARRRVLTVA